MVYLGIRILNVILLKQNNLIPDNTNEKIVINQLAVLNPVTPERLIFQM